MWNGARDVLNGSNSEAVLLAVGDAGGCCCTCTIGFDTRVGLDCLTV